MKISNLKIGQILKEGNHKVKVVFIYNNSFEVQYKSGACWTYKENDLNNGILETYIG